MRGIKVWHLAALALSVPLVTAAVPSGCTGGLNPNFRQAIGQEAGTAIPVPTGFLVVGIFNESGYGGRLTYTVTGPASASGAAWTSTWTIGFGTTEPVGRAWACGLQSIDLSPGGEVDVIDPVTGTVTTQTITYTGPVLSGNRTTDPLECGTLVKLTIVPAAGGGQAATYQLIVDLIK
jgi:hypothetical protein